MSASTKKNIYDQQGIPIEIDPLLEADSDTSSDSDYGSGSEYSTDSLTSSIYEYRFENGRRYHAYQEGKYAFPNDESEQERLDIIHHVYCMLMDDKLHLAPIVPDPQRILDIGTGTGIWAIDIAERYPSAEVIGTDLSPIQPSWHVVPPNLIFQIDDAESEWTFRENSFDLVHIRHLNGSIKDWQALLNQAFRATKPGGWLELGEYEMNLFSDDGTVKEDSFTSRFYTLLNKAADQIGREFKIATSLGKLIEAAGFTDMHYLETKAPVGLWPKDKRQKEMGAYLLMTTETAFSAVGMAMLTRVLGMDAKEVDILIDGAKKETKNPKIHAYSRQHVYYAQKPLE